MPRKRRIPEYSDFRRSCDGFNKQLKPLSTKSRFAIGHSREVTAGLSETLHDSEPDGVRHEGEHDRDRQLGFLECDHGRRSDGNNYIRLLHSDLCDKSIQPLGVSFPAQQINCRGATIQPKLAKSLEELMDRRSVRETAVKYRNPQTLLSTCPGRRDRPTQQPDKKRASLHLPS